MQKIYGVDPSANLTPIIVRDAILKCFYTAHCREIKFSGSGEGKDKQRIEETSKMYCEEIVKKAFVDTGGDFQNPTKDSIVKAMNRLAEFSESFRSKETIKDNYDKVMILVNNLK